MKYKAYVINVDSKTKRMERMRGVASEFSLNLERVSAVTADELPVKKSFSPIFNRELSFPELSCFYSHFECWKKIANGKEPFALVLEDDIAMSPKASALLEELEKSTITFDILRLEHPKKDDSIHTDEICEVGEFRFAHLLSRACYTAAMIVSKEGAKKLIKLAEPILPIDEFLFNYYSPVFFKIKTYQIEDVLAWQLESLNLPLPDDMKSAINQSRTVTKKRKSLFAALKKLSKKVSYLCELRRRNAVKVGIKQTEREWLIHKESHRFG